MRISKFTYIILTALLFVMPAAFAADSTKASKEMEKNVQLEQKLGKEAADEAQKTLKFITDENYVKRVEKIGNELAAVANLTEVKASYGNSYVANFAYSFKVVDDKDVNAFSLPSGYIYINKGLLDKVESDDELAGVIAHEIAHASHHHMIFLLKKQSQMDTRIFLLIAAAALGKVNSGDMANIFYGAKLLQTAKVNAYSMEAENDADSTAIKYMIKAKYNPVGMLTFIEKLARQQAYDPRVDQGVFNTHPESRKRAAHIIAELKTSGIEINRRAVSSGLSATVRTTEVEGKSVFEVMLGDTVLFKPADTPTASSDARAKEIAAALNQLLNREPKQRDVKLGPDGTDVYILDTLVLDVLIEDAALSKTTREALATKVKDQLHVGILGEQMKLMF